MTRLRRGPIRSGSALPTGCDGIEAGGVGPTRAGGGGAPGAAAPLRFRLRAPCEGRFLSSPERVSAYAQAAEEAGFESIWVFEHAVIPAGYTSRYPYSAEGRISREDADIRGP